MSRFNTFVFVFCILFAFWIFSFGIVREASASRVDDLRGQIDNQNVKIKRLEEEITKFERELDTTVKKRKTLKTEIKQIETTERKLRSDISLTNAKINRTELSIEELSLKISEKGDDIDLNTDRLSNLLRTIDERESASLVEIILHSKDFSDFFGNIEKLRSLQNGVRENLVGLQILKSGLEDARIAKQKEKNRLRFLSARLVDQKTLVGINKRNKAVILDKTKNRESSYRDLIANRVKLREEFEAERQALEAQLKVAIDPNSLPTAGSGVLKWPFTNARVIKCGSYKKSLGNRFCITQYFGNTPFATKNAQIYNGKGHNGIDFRAPRGTDVLSAQRGTVRYVGDTDKTCRGASYGKWVLIDHENGLSTLYAHLSLIKVSAGDKLSAGDLIAYSGNTGYSTGPHLHLAVFAKQGVKVSALKSRSCRGRTYTIPLAPHNAYLNPLSYL